MDYPALDLFTIVADASSLWERVSGDFIEAPDADRAQARKRLNQWKHVFADDGDHCFSNRLRWSNLCEDDVLPLLDKVVMKEPHRLPAWSRILKAICENGYELSGVTRSVFNRLLTGVVELREPIPMEDVFLPHLIVARRELMEQLCRRGLPEPAVSRLVAPSARHQLERGLLKRLSIAGVLTLFLEFQRFKAERPGQNSDSSPTGREQYEQFRDMTLRDGYAGLYTRYPVLGRIHATLVLSWAETTSELILRLDADLPALREVFADSPKGSQTQTTTGSAVLVEVQPNLSHPFGGGRTAASLRFQSGLRLMYKPKPLGMDRAFSSLLTWFNHNGAPTSFRPLRVLDRSNYGWLEYVEPFGMKGEKEVEKFYYRAGALTAVLHLLSATDCHENNLFAAGEHFQLIDAETLCQPQASSFDRSEAATERTESPWAVLSQSVLRTQMIPTGYLTRGDGYIPDASALGGRGDTSSPHRRWQWRNINLDTMEMIACEQRASAPVHGPKLNSEPLAPFNYLDSIGGGFRDMYRYLCNKREMLLGSASPLAAFSLLGIRFIPRNTTVYSALITESLRPENLAQGVDRSIAVDVLARAYAVPPQKPDAWPVVHDEISAIERLDIPYFRAKTSSTSLSLPLTTQILKEYLKHKSYDELRWRLEGFSERDLEIQSALMQSAFHAKWMHQNPGVPMPGTRNRSSLTGIEAGPIDLDVLRETAVWLGKRLHGRALVGKGGATAWLGVGGLNTEVAQRIGPTDHSFLTGQCGIALFLAALDHVRGTRDHRDLVDGALQTVAQTHQACRRKANRLQHAPASVPNDITAGHSIYALCKITEYTREHTRYLSLAHDLALGITEEQIRSDTAYGVVSGAAGTILNLLKLYEFMSEQWILDKAVLCGEHLVRNAIECRRSGTAFWESNAEPRSLLGMINGIAGIALALFRLSESTREERFSNLARRAIRLERRCFQERILRAVVPDLKPRGTHIRIGDISSWSSGAPGIGLARMAAQAAATSACDLQELESLVNVSLTHLEAGPENLYSGTFGRVEFLMHAAEYSKDLALKDHVLRLVGQRIRLARCNGGFQCDEFLPRTAAVDSFARGHAGIGYHLLRLAHPDRLGCVLTWD